ncbi:MAG: DUF2188 domain-containing protein [Patescibacteria group bacterium]|nr:DUF2188 domain-containing protein [Patescibacteria group bacterium]
MPKNYKKIFVEREGPKTYKIYQGSAKKEVGGARTQGTAIEKAQKMNPDELLVERVRNTDVGHPDQWRKP